MPDAARDLLLNKAFWGVILEVSFDSLCPRPVRVSNIVPCGSGQGQILGRSPSSTPFAQRCGDSRAFLCRKDCRECDCVSGESCVGPRFVSVSVAAVEMRFYFHSPASLSALFLCVGGKITKANLDWGLRAPTLQCIFHVLHLQLSCILSVLHLQSNCIFSVLPPQLNCFKRAGILPAVFPAHL